MQCHPHARGSFVDFDPHADHTDPHGSPLLYWCYRGFMTLLVSVFAFFGSHSVLWLVRGMVDVFKHGRPQSLTPGATAYVRFASPHRLAHAVLLVSFLGLAATGLPLKYSEHDWAKRLALSLGGFASTSLWHRFFALGTFACFFVYVLAMVRLVRTSRRRGESWRGALFGPDSLVPNWRDAKDFVRMMRWFVGLGPRPSFERWAYWEKFDFWGASADIVIIGVTGLILWFPNLFCSFLPGISLNIAKVIHSTQALLATGFVFAVHFFHTHLRIEKFPADMSVLTGMVSEDELEEERKDYLERIRRTGAFESLRTQVPSRKRLWIMRLWGFVALAAGLALLAGILVGAMGG
jgi:cytochrome b subunit of formate dehydrogenase